MGFDDFFEFLKKKNRTREDISPARTLTDTCNSSFFAQEREESDENFFFDYNLMKTSTMAARGTAYSFTLDFEDFR